MAKRGLNIYKRKDGRYEGRYRSGYTPDGKAKYTSVYGKSYSAVKETLEHKRADLYNNPGVSCKLTMGEIVQTWLTDIRNKVKISTLANYEMKLKKHILPPFCFPLSLLSAEQVVQFKAKILTAIVLSTNKNLLSSNRKWRHINIRPQVLRQKKSQPTKVFHCLTYPNIRAEHMRL